MVNEYIISIESLLSTENEEVITGSVEEFAQLLSPIEDHLYVHLDNKTGARYCECHIKAEEFINLSTTDVPLDPDEQPEYRANREIMEDATAFEQMKSDALEGRTFSNIVAEFDTKNDSQHPLKIIGGQHRFIAINDAYEKNIFSNHGVKVYFNLDLEQRLDVQLISNVNIAVSTDLYDRLQETAKGPELRIWCQKAGFLDPGQDFSAKRKLGSAITVRAARSFIMNFYLGQDIDTVKFQDSDTTPILCKTGKPDPDWDNFKAEHPDIWMNQELAEAGKHFMLLDKIQREKIEELREKDRKIPSSYADKALTFSVMNGWAYISGTLQNNETRLQRHYNLPESKGKDPLNSMAMADGRHKSDPENYRGLGTRNNAKERGRLVELFFLQAEKGKGITPKVIDLAIKRYHIKQDLLEARKIEESM